MCRRGLFFVLFVFLSSALFSENKVSFLKKPNFPKKLSGWKLFVKNKKGFSLNERVEPYDLVNPLFTDYALKFRTLLLPKGEKIIYEEDGSLSFPIGTVLSKTFSYHKDSISFEDRSPTNLGSLKDVFLIETRLLVKTKEKWYSLPYVWEKSQEDAKLSVIGASFDLNLRYEDLSEESFTYEVPNMNQCISCHMEIREGEKIFKPLGPKLARNLNRLSPFDENSMNQLEKLRALGLIKNLPSLDQVGKVASWEDESVSYDRRARAYLDANCAHCHNLLGSANTSGLFLNLENIDRTSYGFCKKPVASGNGSSGGHFDISPSDPFDSIIYRRMHSRDPSVMMPELGRSLIHKEGTNLIYRWISGMEPSCY